LGVGGAACRAWALAPRVYRWTPPTGVLNVGGEGANARPRRSSSVQMNDFQQPRAQFHLHDPAAVVLEQQPADHCRLQQHDGESRHRLPVILVPQAQWTKPDFAPRRQPALADTEALQLTPVEHRLGEIAADDGNLRGSLAVENAQRDPCGRLCYRDGRRDQATRAAVADTGFGIDYDRPVGDSREGRETFMRNIG